MNPAFHKETPPPQSSFHNEPPPQSNNSVTDSGGRLQFGPFDTNIEVPPWADQAIAGYGKAFVDVGRGVRTRAYQFADAIYPQKGESRADESRREIAKSRELDKPLMDTWMGKIGNFAGAATIAAPAAAIPGANTVAGGAMIGAGTGFFQPSVSSNETALNIGLGGGFGGAGAKVGEKVANYTSGRIAGRQAESLAQSELNAERDSVLFKAKKAGYAVPITAINDGATNTALESISGKAATRQSLTAKNVKVTNGLVRQDLGMPPNSPITPVTLDAVRKREGAIYEQVKRVGTVESDAQYHKELADSLTGSPQLETAYPGIGGQADQRLLDLVNAVKVDSHDSSGMVEALKLVRSNAKSNFKRSFIHGDPDARALAQGQQDVADAMEGLLTRHLEKNGHSDLAASWENARRTIAKAHSAEAALKGGEVSSAQLAQQVRKGRPMSGGMQTAADFGENFADVAGHAKSGVGVSKLAAMLGGITEAGAGYLHSPELALGGIALAGAPYVARAGITSKVGQSLLATPNYAPSTTGTSILNGLGFLGKNGARAGGLPLAQLTARQD